ncbi:MAG: tail fiber domain-containing protein [Bacteroidota bacterium]
MSALWGIETNAQVNVPSSTYSALGYIGWNSVNNVPFWVGGIGGTPAGWIDVSNGNAAFGYYTFPSTLSGINNCAFGAYALQNATSGYYNVALGNTALNHNTTGWNNVALGVQALQWNTTGIGNNAIGLVALQHNISGQHNSANGNGAMASNTAASENTAMGWKSLWSQNYYYVVGSDTPWFATDNVAIGSLALYNNNPTATTNAIRNTAVGDSSLYSNTIGNMNSALGHISGFNNTEGTNNSFIGNGTGLTNVKGNFNTLIGDGSDVATDGLQYATAVGASSIVPADHTVSLGNTTTNNNVVFNGALMPYYSSAYQPGTTGQVLTSQGANTDPIWADFIGFGNCNSPPSLTTDAGINLSNNNLVFKGTSATLNQNNIGIGTGCGPSAKLHIFQAQTGTNFSTINVAFGLKSIANNTNNPYRCAGFFYAKTGCPIVIPSMTTPTPFALFTPGDGGRISFGYANLLNPPTDARVSINGTSDPYPGPPCYQLALKVNGGVVLTSGYSTGSDSIIKTNVVSIGSSTRNLLNHLRPVQFYFDTINYSFMNLPSVKQFGFIAQEVDTVYSNLVDSTYYPTQYDTAGTTIVHDSAVIKCLNLQNIIPLLTSGFQFHDSLITSIQNNFKGAQNGAWVDTGKVEWGTSPLLHNTTLPMVSPAGEGTNEYSIYFTGQSSMSKYNPVDVGIGYYDTTVALRAKLDVVDSTFSGEDFSFTNQYAGRFYQTGRYNADGGDEMIGVAGITDVMPGEGYGLVNIGGDFRAKNSRINIGGRGTASDSLGDKYGLIGQSSGNNNCFGISGYAGGSNTNYGIYGGATSGGGIVSYAGYFSGDLAYTGALISISDSTVKQNIHPLTGAQAILNQVHPKVYNFDTVQYGYMNLKGGTEYGVLAQDLMNVLPSAVKDVIQPAVYDNQNNMIHPALHLKGVDYIEFIPLLIQSNRQMDSTIQALQSQLIALQNCCDKNQPPQQNSIRQKDGGNGDNGNGGSGNEKKLENGNIHAIELSNASGSPIIYQNIPNPFSNGGTKIRYFVPDNTNNPQIVFFDEFGGKLSTYAILETGMGELDVTASNLSSGVYSYSLIINGKAIDTKKMIFQK